MTLSEFLLARLDDDEATVTILECVCGEGVSEVDPLPSCPDRVLAEVAAKRAAIEAAWDDHVRIEGEWGSGQSRAQMDAENDVPAVVAHLAAVYNDHPDYAPSWRP